MRQDTYGLDNYELSYKMSKLSDGITQEFWFENRDGIERYIRDNYDKPELIKRFYDGLENRVVERGLKDLGVKKYKDLLSDLIRSKFYRLFNSKNNLLRGELPMQKDFRHKTASRLEKWASSADTPEERVYLQKLAQEMGGPASQVGLSNDGLTTGVAPEVGEFGGDMAAMQGQPIDLSTGNNPEEEKGEFDITREPASPMWNVELLRVKANSAEEAQEIVEKFVGWARDNGQPRISVGTIKSSRDDEAKK